MDRNIIGEHRALEALLKRARTLLGSNGDLRDLRESFEAFRDALEVHLTAEENLYFPTIWCLRPEHETPLRNLIQTHSRFRELLSEIATQLKNGSSQKAAGILERLAENFENHEGLEEKLLGSIDREILASSAL